MRARHTLLLCALLTVALGVPYAAPLWSVDGDRRAMLPGRTSRGHEPFEALCERCHTPFVGVTNQACLHCHQEGLGAGEDLHPESKFSDPRNADRVAGFDARACVTCHREHVPGHTRAGGVTLPGDFCVACHSEITRERPSHAFFSFAGCARVGCHRFHDNRSLYEGFLAQHLHEPEQWPVPSVARIQRRHEALRRSLRSEDADAPLQARTPASMREWLTSAHAQAGVNCTQCHGVRDASTAIVTWKDRPGDDACSACHDVETVDFEHGPHGVRSLVGLAPRTVAMARLAMHAEASARTLGCNTCHAAHAYDTAHAAVDACLGCHDDNHSRGYAATRHARAWNQRGAAETGVSCATCHLPRRTRRVSGVDEVRVDHQVSSTLRPRDKMVRAACLACHGLGFAIDALADDALVARNFNGRPAVHVESLEMVEERIWGKDIAGHTTRHNIQEEDE